ncbi:MAG: calcium/proton exchanger, partial [Deltaproteobacteria bacterium]
MPNRSNWGEAFKFSLGNWRISILALVPVAILLKAFHASPILIFAASSLAIIPLSSLLGDATEELAAHSGPALGGFLNSTLGNLTELIIGVLALWSGHVEVVKASLTGSIIGNLLLVFGLSALVGGIGREKLTFNRVAVGANTSMLFLAVVALVMPALYDLTVFGTLREGGPALERLSFWTALVLLACYAASLIFTFRTHRNLYGGEGETATLSRTTAIAILFVTAALIGIVSEILVGQIEAVTRQLGWTELFVGLIVVATVGNAAEHSTAVLMARRNKMDLALSITIGSSTQIALFVAPVLVLLSQARPEPMSLVFHPLEIAAVILSAGIATLVSLDGETNWL